jgi:hypothetical protein
VRFNDQPLAGNTLPDEDWSCDVTDRLQLRNRIELEFNTGDTPAAELRTALAAGAVQLEITQ